MWRRMTPESESQTEAILHQAILRGNEGAWNVLFQRHFGLLYRYIYVRSGKNREMTEDIVQECWLVAVRRIGSFEPERAPFQAWLQGIARNVLLNHRRRGQRRHEMERSTEIGAEHGTSRPQDWNIDTAELVSLALTSLSPAYQEAITAKYGEGLTVAEMAARSGKSPKAVESLISRARAAFRREYKQLDDESKD